MKPLVQTYWAAGMLLLCGFLSGCSPPSPPIPSVPSAGLSPDWIHSLEAARQDVVSNRTSGDSWGRLGQKFHAAELHPVALTCYREAQRLTPWEQRWWHLSGSIRVLETIEAGVADLRTAVITATNSLNREVSRFLLARSLLESGQGNEATEELVGLLRESPAHAGAHLALARIQQARRQLSEAEAHLTPCLTNPYTARPALLLLSQIRQQQGRAEEAQRLSQQGLAAPRNSDWPDPFLREVLRLKEGSAMEEDRVNRLISQGRLAEADQAATQLATRFPNDSTSALLLGRLRLQQRRCAEAEEAFRKYLERSPDSFNGLVQLGSSLLCQERWSAAVETLRKALTLKPDSAQAHHNLGIALHRSGDPAQAALSFREALRYNPLDAGTCALLAETLFKLNQREEAIRNLDRALQLNPRQARALELKQSLAR